MRCASYVQPPEPELSTDPGGHARLSARTPAPNGNATLIPCTLLLDRDSESVVCGQSLWRTGDTDSGEAVQSSKRKDSPSSASREERRIGIETPNLTPQSGPSVVTNVTPQSGPSVVTHTYSSGPRSALAARLRSAELSTSSRILSHGCIKSSPGSLPQAQGPVVAARRDLPWSVECWCVVGHRTNESRRHCVPPPPKPPSPRRRCRRSYPPQVPMAARLGMRRRTPRAAWLANLIARLLEVASLVNR